MITALSILTPENSRGIRRLFNSLRKDKVCVELKRARGVCIKHITYTSYKGNVNIDKIDRFIGAQRNHLLCDETINFPKESGYKRFHSSAFAARLCTNMALYVISKCKNPENLKIGIYDTDGNLEGFLKCVLKFCADVTVITDRPENYYDELNSTMEELGATAVITNQRDGICNCDFVIAPYIICEKLPIKETALVLTGGNPKVDIKCFVYSKYYFKMPNGFDKIKPQELDEEYFCSALYTLGSQYELGSIIPKICRNNSTSQTIKSLCSYLDNLM